MVAIRCRHRHRAGTRRRPDHPWLEGDACPATARGSRAIGGKVIRQLSPAIRAASAKTKGPIDLARCPLGAFVLTSLRPVGLRYQSTMEAGGDRRDFRLDQRPSGRDTAAASTPVIWTGAPLGRDHPMAHHYSGPALGFPHGDARLDLTDLYVFGKPGDDRKSILIMTFIRRSAWSLAGPPGLTRSRMRRSTSSRSTPTAISSRTSPTGCGFPPLRGGANGDAALRPGCGGCREATRETCSLKQRRSRLVGRRM